MFTYYLKKEDFSSNKKTILENEHFKVETFKYSSGIEAVNLINSKGFTTILPFYGQIIWDVVFDDVSLTMDHMFKEPKLGSEIVDTYGCFAFHSGLLANGCPGEEDTHPLHGEFPCSQMEMSYLRFSEEKIMLFSEFEYVKGFGHHYQAVPNVTMYKDATQLQISLEVQNLSNYQPMPLQYMCHMNYAYIDNAQMSQNIPNEAFRLRTSIPGHVNPTAEWTAYMKELEQSGEIIGQLERPDMYDPEICFFGENLNNYIEQAEFEMKKDNQQFFIRFNTAEFPYTTRWLLHNADQKVAAFALPATCLPEGYSAAQKAGSLIQLAPHEKRSFTVITGMK